MIQKPLKPHKKQSKERETTLALRRAIRYEYERLENLREFGVRKYSQDWIIQKLAHKFYRSNRTIEDIIYYRD